MHLGYLHLLAAALVTFPLQATSAHKGALLTVHDKDRFGVSFRYPASWSPHPLEGFYLAQPESLAGPAVAAVSRGSGYSGTDFSGAQFEYSVRLDGSELDCSHINRDLGKSEPQVIRGIRYSHLHTDDAAMMHQRSDDLYSVYRNGSCFVFDLAFLTSGFGARDGVRRMTDAETRSVLHQLQEILASVEFR